jgi:hypothetical protein
MLDSDQTQHQHNIITILLQQFGWKQQNIKGIIILTFCDLKRPLRSTNISFKMCTLIMFSKIRFQTKHRKLDYFT